MSSSERAGAGPSGVSPAYTDSSAHQSSAATTPALPVASAAVMFVAPEVPAPLPRRASEPDVKPNRGRREKPEKPEKTAQESGSTSTDSTPDEEDSPQRRRRGRRGRGRGRGDGDGDVDGVAEGAEPETDTPDEEVSTSESSANDDENVEELFTRRRRRRRRRGEGTDVEAADDGQRRDADGDDAGRADRGDNSGKTDRNDKVRAIKGSARLEAKRQRRRDGRDQRRRPSILSEAEFLARRESVERVMVVRQRGDLTQIAVLEDEILVEHYVTRSSAVSYVGNVYLGKVQNVLPSMEAAFIDIGKGRNAVLYAGEVNWDLAGLEGKPRKIEQALKSGDTVLVQVTKDPIGHKGARLTSQISLPGRFLVYVPGGEMTGISRKLPDTERKRLKDILRTIVPENAGVIIRTAAEGASEEELARDVARLKAQWETIEAKVAKGATQPTLLSEEPDLVIRVIRDIFNEDFNKLVVSGDGGSLDAGELVEQYVAHVSPDLVDRVSRHVGDNDVFAQMRVDEQLTKALDRKVWLPSGGSLVIDRTEAMTVIDVNTGRFTGQGGSLEETVTRNNLEAAEEIVRQLRLRDIGGIIVIDFIDMVLESNRELVLRRMTECLGRDRTRHQVAEVTSLGLVQMTRKRVGQGLLEAFSESCEHCRGRGLIIHSEPLPEQHADHKEQHKSGEGKKGKRRQAGPKLVEEPISLAPRDASGEADDDNSTGADALGSISSVGSGEEADDESNVTVAG